MKGLKDATSGEGTDGPANDPTQEDPYLLYGFGIYAYFDLLKILMTLFTILTFVFTPAIYFNMQYEGIIAPEDYAAYSLGNQGYSEAQCFYTPIQAEITSSVIQCQEGTIIGEIFGYGIISAGDAALDTCYFEDDAVNTCLDYVDSVQLTADITLCFNLASCPFTPVTSLWVSSDQTSIDAGCYDQDALFFV
jgi:hypothetical protein